MKLTNFLLHKKIGQVNNIKFKNDSIIFNEINAILQLNEWKYSELNEFDNFISKYNFPKIKATTKKDRDAVRDCFPKPQVLLKRNKENDTRIALALYHKKTLTGETLLHLKSINKFEQMEIKYFLSTTNAPINEPKIQKQTFYTFAQSSDIYFDYNFTDNLTIKSARLRIVTLQFGEFIILMYAFDQNLALKQEELDSLINSFKSTA